jgi:hypothetical protein
MKAELQKTKITVNMILTVVHVIRLSALKATVPNRHPIQIRPLLRLHLKRVEVVVETTVVTIPTFWTVLKQNVTNNRAPDQTNNSTGTILTVKNADPTTPNTMKMSDFAELNM